MKASSDARFENFRTCGDLQLETALAKSHEFVRRVKADPYGEGYVLTLCGPSGTGKTFLARCILAGLNRNAWGVCESIPEEMRGGKLVKFEVKLFDLRKVSDKLKAREWGIVEAMEEPPLAVLDDIGADYDPNKITASKVDRVLRTRRAKWTVVTINLGLNEIADRLDSRIASFLIRDENQFIEINSTDFSLRNQLK